MRQLIGSGDKIGLLLLPFVVVGVVLNVVFPTWFEVGGPPEALRTLSIAVLAVGVVIWLWTVVLILTTARRGELITTGPFLLVTHPLYVGVALLVLPWLGFLLDTWLGVVLGAVLYVGRREFAGEEEAELSARFGDEWDEYRAGVLLPWL
ncbi:MAG TPA: hypothetical protein VF235_07575 [Actinomycetota bacterium]